MTLSAVDFRKAPNILPHPATNRPGSPLQNSAALWPETETYLNLRFLPLRGGDDKLWMRLASHRWPGCRVNCPKWSDERLVSRANCPVCDVMYGGALMPYSGETLTTEFAYIVNALALSENEMTHPIRLAFSGRYFLHFSSLIQQGAFDTEHGRCMTLVFRNNSFSIFPGECRPLDREARTQIRMLSDFSRYKANQASLANVAAAYKAHISKDWLQPQYGQSVHLREMLPGCTLVPIPFAFKGPVERGWQNTSYEMMRLPSHIERLERGNVGCLCGFDEAAYDQGLIPHGCVVCLDADDDQFADELLRRNPWLNDTFAVKGHRGMKYFVRFQDADLTEQLRSKKIVDANGRDVGDWLSTGKQGVVAGLHPAGLLYEIFQEKVLLDVSAAQFALPAGYRFGSVAAKETSHRAPIKPRPLFNRYRAITQSAPNNEDSLLDLAKLEDVQLTARGTQARCPACAENGKDTAGDNLLIYPDGRYCCTTKIGLSDWEKHEHNRRILAMAAKV